MEASLVMRTARSAMREKKISRTAYLLLEGLAYSCRPKGGSGAVIVTYRKLRRLIGAALDTTVRAMKQLCAAGFVVLERRGAVIEHAGGRRKYRQLPNSYRLRVPLCDSDFGDDNRVLVESTSSVNGGTVENGENGDNSQIAATEAGLSAEEAAALEEFKALLATDESPAEPKEERANREEGGGQGEAKPVRPPDWGHIEEGVFVPLPKMPMTLAGYGPPPFSVKLSDGRVRHVIEDPALSEAEDGSGAGRGDLVARERVVAQRDGPGGDLN